MRISDLPFFGTPKNTVYVDWKLRVTRMKKLLENARAFLGYLSDGREKLTAEYIIDERYVLSLVEKVLERTSMMVHDACLLAPEGGGELYRLLDEYWRKARKDYLGPIHRPKGSEGAAPGEEPEVKRLAAAMDWFMKGDREAGSLFSFFKKLVEHVVKGTPQGSFPIQGMIHLDVYGPGPGNRFRLMDLDKTQPKGSSPTATVTDISCRPLGLMLMGCPAGPRPDGGAANRQNKWFAAMDEDHLSLFSEAPQSPALWLSATLSGHADSDFIFVLGNQTDPSFFPDGFSVETAGEITFGWIYDVPTHRIEKSLVSIGKRCFAD